MIDKYGVGQDPYCYPGSTVLKNLLAIHDEQQLSDAEVALSEQRMLQFVPQFDALDFAYLCAIHHHLFQDLYEWAGHVRTVDISKDTTHFCNVRFIEASAQRCMQQLVSQNFFQQLPKQQFVAQLADFFCEMNVVHPFREGNGRTLRLFCEVLALQAGYEISWRGIAVESWLEANVAGYHGDLVPLIQLFSDAVSLPSDNCD